MILHNYWFCDECNLKLDGSDIEVIWPGRIVCPHCGKAPRYVEETV